MKIKIVGKHGEQLIELLERYQCHLVEHNPELVISCGGDGALLGAEQDFPGIPKLPLRGDNLCPKHSLLTQIDDFFADKTPAGTLMKLNGSCGELSLQGINDIFIHNLDPVSAVRYRLWIDDELYANEIVGDGVGVATVHGSTAYYRSITHSIFRLGIGLAFSNSTEVVNHLVLPEETVIRVKIIRGPAIMVADNCPEWVELFEDDEIIMRKHSTTATVFGLKNFMCPACRQLRHPKKELI